MKSFEVAYPEDYVEATGLYQKRKDSFHSVSRMPRS